MTNAKLSLFVVIVLALVAAGVFFAFSGSVRAPAVSDDTTDTVDPEAIIYYSGVATPDLIDIDAPRPGATISSPLAITGSARGQWYFEATFPVTLTDWDGLIIAEGYATAQGDWMTTDLVPFRAALDFTVPECAADTDYCTRGTLILHRSNASGLPEHDGAAEMTVWFR